MNHRRTPQVHNDRPLLFFLALGLALALGAATQYVAWRLKFHSNLGPPLVILSARGTRLLRVVAVIGTGAGVSALLLPRFRRVAPLLLLIALCSVAGGIGPIYAPYQIIVWQAKVTNLPGGEPVLSVAWLLAGGMLVMTATLVTRSWRSERDPPPSHSHGSAHWGTGAILHQETGLLLGRQGARLLRLAGEGHVLTVAPTRSGKGVSAVIPNLLEYPGSVLVTDPKGENYAVTARRRRELGQVVHAFDPFDVVGGLASFNPLDLIDASGLDAVDDARMIADMLVVPEGRQGEQVFWNEEARGVLTGLILHVAANAPRELRTLSYVRMLLTLAPESFAELLVQMRDSPAVGGLVARAAARLLQKADRERSGVISTAQSHTHFLDSPRMARVLSQSTVDLAVLKRRAASIFLILPPDRLESYARWQRLMIACSLLAMTRTPGQPRCRVLFLLDEFPHLGKMAPVQRDIGLVGGYGARFWLMVQDLSQLKTAYGEAWTTFLANADALQAFGTNDWETAEYLSKMTGEATIRVDSENQSAGVSRGSHAQRQTGSAVTTAERARRLLLPDEVRRLPRDVQLLFVKGSAPLLVDRLDYLRDPEFADRADPNPLYTSSSEGLAVG